MIVRKEITALTGVKLADVLAMPNVRVLVKGSYSYGPLIDGLFEKLKPTLLVADVEVRQMVEMIKANRGDILIASEEEANYLMKEADREERPLRI
jgi:polar amino acid transport system substrate-binding protein